MGDSRELRAKRKATTIAVIVVVALIILILIALTAPRAISRESSGPSQEIGDLSMIRSALNQFRLAVDRFPTNAEGLGALLKNPGLPSWNGPYLEKELRDRWGSPYVYRHLGSDRFLLCTYGADGKPGGEGEDADLGDEVN